MRETNGTCFVEWPEYVKTLRHFYDWQNSTIPTIARWWHIKCECFSVLVEIQAEGSTATWARMECVRDLTEGQEPCLSLAGWSACVFTQLWVPKVEEYKCVPFIHRRRTSFQRTCLESWVGLPVNQLKTKRVLRANKSHSIWDLPVVFVTPLYIFSYAYGGYVWDFRRLDSSRHSFVADVWREESKSHLSFEWSGIGLVAAVHTHSERGHQILMINVTT